MDYGAARVEFERLFLQKMSDDEAREFLVELYEKGESSDEIAAAAEVMRSHALNLEIPELLQDKIIDIVGTGGDKSGSINVSSTCAFILASCGCYVAKHGNRSITSKSGSADMLEALGIKLTLTPLQQLEMLQDTGFVFMFAQAHHPAMKHIMPIRKSIEHRTVFNLLGPLTNPAGAKRELLGVYSELFLHKLTEALMRLGSIDVLAVSSRDGLDEISISDITYFSHLKDGNITEGEIDPQILGMSLAPLDAIKGGDGADNARVCYQILAGSIDDARRDIILLNAGAAFMVEGSARDMQDGVEMALDAILCGKALAKLNNIVDISSRI